MTPNLGRTARGNKGYDPVTGIGVGGIRKSRAES